MALIYLVFKRIAITALKGICRDGAGHYEWTSQLAYEKRPDDGRRFLKPHMAQGVTLMKTLYYASVIFGVIGVVLSSYMMEKEMLSSVYYPVFSVIMLGEIYFFLDGDRKEGETRLSAETDRATKLCQQRSV